MSLPYSTRVKGNKLAEGKHIQINRTGPLQAARDQILSRPFVDRHRIAPGSDLQTDSTD